MSTATTTATIMIVEDEVPVRELLVLALEANEFGVVSAGNSSEALACLQSRQIDLLLLDLKLGEESGIELLKTIRGLEGYEKLPVILLTGLASREVVLEAAHLGVQGYVLKHQFSRKDLTARIEQILEKRDPPPSATSAAPAIPQPRPAPAAPPAPAPPPRADSNLQQELLRSIKPVLTRSQILDQVDRCVELKALSTAVSQLMAATSEPDCSIDQVAGIIKTDPGIATKILKIANSVVYGYSGSIDTVQQAVLRIGISQIRQLVLSMAVIDNFRGSGLGQHFSGELFWEHSIATGLIAASIARFCSGDKHSMDFAFTMGLLHDVARMVFVEQLDDMYKRVLDTAARTQLPLEQVESRMLLVNHAEIAGRLLGAWNFPRPLIDAIAMHHLPASKIVSMPPQKGADVATLALADRLAHALLLGSSGNSCVYPIEELVKYLPIDPDSVRLIEQQIPSQTADMKHVMLSGDDASATPDFRQRAQAKLQRPLRPFYVSPEPAIDAHRIMLDRLRQMESSRAENLAVVYLAQKADPQALFQAIRQREAELCIRPLPVIVLMHPMGPSLDRALLSSRDHVKIVCPFAFGQLADAVNCLLVTDDR
jgi:HD-like signal output (HDOD) protein/CheY-like chemotaxis protein